MPDDLNPAVDENSTESILDVFSMEFESPDNGGTEPATEPAKPAEEPASAPTDDSSKTDEPATPADGSDAPGAGEPASQPEEEDNAKSTEPSAPVAPTNEALLAEALKAINALSAKTQEKPAQAKESEKAEEDADTKVFAPKKYDEYTFNISPKLYNGLFSSESTEEDRVTCLQAYASGIATTVHNKILAELGGWVREQFSAIPGAVNYLIENREKVASSQKSLREDFYGAYPELNKPELLPLIKATIQAVQQETGSKTWTKEFRTLVGSRVKNVLGAYAQVGKPAPKAPKTVAPAASPAAPKTGTTDPNSTEAILDVFNSEFN